MAGIPHFIVIGAQKAGTTAAARNLSLHPAVDVFAGTTEYGKKEIEYFNQHWDRGPDWYASHFSDTGRLMGEKTAELLHRTVCHQRMHLVNGHFKIVTLLRSPIERAYSQWKMARFNKRDETDSFDEVVEREMRVLDSESYRAEFYRCAETGLTGWRQGYVLKGMYAEQLESLFQWFPREQVFVGISEQIRAEPSRVYARMFEFLEVEPFDGAFGEHFKGAEVPEMSPRTRAMLAELYREPNERLFQLLGTDVPEWRLPTIGQA